MTLPSLANVPDVHGLPSGVVGQTPLQEEPLRSELMDSLEGFLDGRLVVRGMKVEQVHRSAPGSSSSYRGNPSQKKNNQNDIFANIPVSRGYGVQEQ